MKKKFLGLFLSSIVCFNCAACGVSYDEAVTSTPDIKSTIAGNYFTVITTFGDMYGTYQIVYANDTKVKYLRFRAGSITPLYNADGSLQIYTGE